MTLRELNERTWRREPVDHVLWQPRLEHWYNVNKRQRRLPERYRGLTLIELFDDLGCSVRPYWAFNPCLRVEDAEAVRFEEVRDGPRSVVTCHTPVGKLVTIMDYRGDESDYVVKYPVQTPEDMRVMAWRLEHQRVSFDHAHFAQASRVIGDRAAPSVFIPRTNLLRLVLEYMGVENGLTALYDYPSETGCLLGAINASDEALLDMLAECPVEIINFGDNVHQAFCPPPLFLEWVLPQYQHRNERLHAAAKKTYPHWDGDCRQLLPYLRDCGFDGVEAITPVPQGDVTLEELRGALGDMVLLDGIPCTDFLPETPLESLINNARKCIEYFAPALILGISDEISPVGDIERVRLVSEMVREHGGVEARSR